METLWEKQPTVIIFFRRWGCLFCRLWANDLKEITPILKENNVRLVGVGPEDIGVEDFVAGKFFDGGASLCQYAIICPVLIFGSFQNYLLTLIRRPTLDLASRDSTGSTLLQLFSPKLLGMP
jgi:prostamide/prostaglandin F2alpha synthase